MNEISREELKQLIENKGEYVLIDVRELHEMKHGSIETSHNIPQAEFEAALELSEAEFDTKYGFKLTKSSRLILYCRSGGRSGRATIYAENKGFNAVNYKGSILDWAEIDSSIEKY